jgi:hypothetical protein
MPKLYEEEPSAILYKQLHPRIASLYKTFGDEAWTQQTINGHTTPIFVENSHERPFSIIPKANTYGFLTKKWSPP